MADSSDEGGTGPLLKNRYRLGRVLGRGGMCIVYQAWDTRLQRNVAVKRLEPPLNEDARTRARFDREGRALAQLSHPNLVTLIDRGSSENEDYLVFEYVEGRSLKELIREGQMEMTDIGRIAGQVAEGLAAAHAAGIVHRDVKPQNILIDRAGFAKVTDFGIATGPDWTRVTRAGSVIGSARYMSPEQIRSKPVDARSDIYSLGVVLYEMLTGHPPFDGTNMPEIARMHLSTAPAPISETRADLTEGLERVVMRCLEKLPEDRFTSMDELLGALVGLGLYAPQRVTEVAPASRRARRSGYEERASRASVSGEIRAGTGGEEAEEGQWIRDRARQLARKRRATLRWKVIGAAAAIVVLAVVVVVVVLAVRAPAAPALTNLTLSEAKAAAEKIGMTVEVTDEIPTFDQQAGLVLQQVPEAGGKSDGNKINVTVTREPIVVRVTDIKDADPEGGDGENPAKLPNLIDGKSSTAWTTELYRSSKFGDLKTGVGLDFTLEEEATILEIDSSVEGWKGQLLQNTSAGMTAELADLDGSAAKRVVLSKGIKGGRIWFTQLAKLTENRWGVELSEVKFYR